MIKSADKKVEAAQLCATLCDLITFYYVSVLVPANTEFLSRELTVVILLSAALHHNFIREQQQSTTVYQCFLRTYLQYFQHTIVIACPIFLACSAVS